MRRVSGPLTLLQARALVTRLNTHFGFPSQAVPLTPGTHATPAPVYAPGAIGWTARATRIVRIASRSEIRLELDTRIAALQGQQVGGATLNLGAFTTLETLLGTTDLEAIEADTQETS